MTNPPPPQLPPSNEIIPKPVDIQSLDNYPDNDYPIEVNAPTEYSPTKPQNPQEKGQGSTDLGNQAQFISRGKITNYGNGNITITQKNNKKNLVVAINALKEINLKTIEVQKQDKVTKYRHVNQEKRQDTILEGKGMTIELAWVVLVLNLLW